LYNEYLKLYPRVRVRTILTQKKACPARVAGAGLENIETVHEPKPTQAADTLWGQGRRAMKDLHGPQTQVREGTYAIKVSMSCSEERAMYLKHRIRARTSCGWHQIFDLMALSSAVRRWDRYNLKLKENKINLYEVHVYRDI